MNTDSEYVFQTPLNGKHLGWLFGMVFGVRGGERSPIVPYKDVPLVAQAVENVLLTLTPREERVLRMYLGLNLREQEYSLQRIAERLGTSRYRIKQIQSRALRKLRHPSRSTLLKVFLDQTYGEVESLPQESNPERLVELLPVVETIKRLEPSLIAHLRRHTEDLDKINPLVFEHLIAEFLAARGFTDVRLVGRNPRTSADIFAADFIRAAEIPVKVFVEVKRWRETVGVEVIHQVLGAF